MNDLQIDKALALAIGWKQHQIGLGFHGSEQCIGINESLAGDSGEPRTFYDKSAGGWCVVFDHKDWNVIGPIAKRYGMHVDFARNIAWPASNSVGTSGNSPQQAIALERIKRARK
jgi:hypothetical protein